MEVKIVSATECPLQAISIAAGTCYGKPNISEKRVRNCFNAGHMTVFEHAVATFEVKGISRACSHQLVRHRLASYSQQSQRYCRIDVDNDDWYVTPPDIAEDAHVREAYGIFMREYAKNYTNALADHFKPEDARYLLPEACKTDICMTMNLREIYHFLDLRQSHRAQWEIRELAYLIEAVLAGCNSEWEYLMNLRHEDQTVDISEEE